jgi:hypothetical protein
MNISIFNNGAGFGDILSQLVFAYSFCLSRNVKFFITDIYSPSHNTNYTNDIFLINSPFYIPLKNIPENITTISSSSLHSIDLESKLEYINIVWDYEVNNHYLYYGIEKKSLPFFDYFPQTFKDLNYKVATVHLRMGDARSYNTRIGVFDVEKLSPGINWRYQWTPLDVEKTIRFLHENGFFVIGVTDGESSAIRRIEWSNIKDYSISKEDLIFDVKSSCADDLSKVAHLFDKFIVETASINLTLRAMLTSSLIVGTSGSFGANIHENFFPQGGCEFYYMKDFVRQLSS